MNKLKKLPAFKALTEENTIIESKLFAEKIIDFFHFKEKLNNVDLDAMANELLELHKHCASYLDKKFLTEVCSGESVKVYSSLWEIIIVNHLLKHPSLSIAPHSDNGPDWKIKLIDGKEYYVEATSAHIPTADNSEICRVISEMQNKGTSYFDNILVDEVKSRISNAIVSKIKKHGGLLAKNKNIGYILAVSYGGIPLFASYDLYKAVETILPIGPLTLKIARQNNEIIDKYLARQEQFIKPTSNAPITTNIFGNEEYNWISAILYSKIEPCLLLENAGKLPGIEWNGVKNDFVLVHNPTAQCPLLKDIFSSRTKIIVEDGKLITSGENIFPW